MAGQNLSPRQKMIGMMYLVLTALLALNVSKEIINAFVTVNDSLEISNENTSKRNERIYSDFQKAMQNDPAKVGPFNDKAQKVKKLSADMNAYINSLKEEMTRKVEAIEDPNAKVPVARDIARKDDYDVPTTMMCGDANDGVGHKATEFKNKLNEFKTNLSKILGPEDAKTFGPRVDQLLNTKDPEVVVDNKRTWEMANFYHNPVVAQLALFTKYQADVRNVESEVINHLYTSIDAGSFKFDQLEARVIAPTSYVLTNQEYKADIFLAAFSSTSNPEIIVGGSPIKVENGMGKYSTRPGSEGVKKYGGVIKVKDPATNEMKEYKFEAEYIAAKPASVVSADKMNVLYIGVENPMSISVPGVADANVSATVSGGGVTISKDAKSGSSKYIAKATTQGEATFNVNAKLDGKNVPMGTFKYRVKRVPDPVAMIGGKKGGPINKAELAAQTSVNSIMENFDFELYFKVKSFRMTLIRKGKDPTELESTSNLITPQMKAAIQSAGPGAKVYFEYIKASGPDGTTRSLSSVNFVLQ